MPMIAEGFGAGIEPLSQEADVVRRSIEAVVTAVNVADRRGGELVGIEIIEQRHLHGVKGA
jgi:hypothetical protein